MGEVHYGPWISGSLRVGNVHGTALLRLTECDWELEFLRTSVGH